MNLVLVRIDDRLVHGQVVQGCCGPLQARRILLANDEAALDPLQSRLYRAAAPPEVELIVAGLEDAQQKLREWNESDDPIPTVLVAENPADLLRLIEGGAPITRVNLGGAHHREGTRELWPGYYLDDRARSALLEILSRGIAIEVQSIPGAPATDARAVLEGS